MNKLDTRLLKTNIEKAGQYDFDNHIVSVSLLRKTMKPCPWVHLVGAVLTAHIFGLTP